MEKTARTKLADRNMHWEETYTESTEKYKEMYEDIIGEGSYYRWEGKDVDSGEEYFAIVGPAKIKTPIASWFAGCRKLPADWAAGGKYFSEIKEAMKYANETWGITIPSDFDWGYDSGDLKKISDRMDEWKEKHTTEAKKDIKMGKFSTSVEFPIHLYIESKRKIGDIAWERREGNKFFDGEQIIDGDPEFERLIEEKPELAKAKGAILREREKRKGQIKDAYGPEYLNADFYQIFIAHSENWGTHLIVISPYFGTYYPEALDKFSLFRKNLWIANQAQIDVEVDKFIAEYLSKYGVHLMPEDVRVSGVEYCEPSFDLSKSGNKKVKSSPVYQENLNVCKQEYNAKDESEVNKKVSEDVKKYKTDKKFYDNLVKEYKRKQKSGEALEHDIPPPPQLNRVGYNAYQKMHPKIKRMPGQHTMTKIFKENPPVGMSAGEATAEFGFDSMQEAVSYVISKMPGNFPTQKISSLKPVTSADLKKAREKHNKQKTLEEQIGEQNKEDIALPTIDPSIEIVEEQPIEAPEEQPIEAPEEMGVLEEDIDILNPETPSVTTSPDKDIVEKPDKPKTSLEEILKRINDRKKERETVSKTILNLVKLAENLDKENKPDDAEEIHKILRKHVGK